MHAHFSNLAIYGLKIAVLEAWWEQPSDQICQVISSSSNDAVSWLKL